MRNQKCEILNKIIMPDINSLLTNIDLNAIVNFASTPSFKNIGLGALIYAGLLWLSTIVWVTRDAINRSDSIIFHVISIFLNIAFPVLGVLLYLIIRPSKTTTERYYEELEHKLIMENIEKKKTVRPRRKVTIKKISKKPAKVK